MCSWYSWLVMDLMAVDVQHIIHCPQTPKLVLFPSLMTHSSSTSVPTSTLCTILLYVGSLSADIHVHSEGFSICCYWFTRVILFSFIRYLLHVCYFYCLKLYHFYCKFFCSFIFFCSCLRVSCGVFKICVHLQLLSDTYTDLFDECNYSVCCTLNHRPQSLYVCGPDNSQLINFYKSL